MRLNVSANLERPVHKPAFRLFHFSGEAVLIVLRVLYSEFAQKMTRRFVFGSVVLYTFHVFGSINHGIRSVIAPGISIKSAR